MASKTWSRAIAVLLSLHASFVCHAKNDEEAVHDPPECELLVTSKKPNFKIKVSVSFLDDLNEAIKPQKPFLRLPMAVYPDMIKGLSSLPPLLSSLENTSVMVPFFFHGRTYLMEALSNNGGANIKFIGFHLLADAVMPESNVTFSANFSPGDNLKIANITSREIVEHLARVQVKTIDGKKSITSLIESGRPELFVVFRDRLAAGVIHREVLRVELGSIFRITKFISDKLELKHGLSASEVSEGIKSWDGRAAAMLASEVPNRYYFISEVKKSGVSKNVIFIFQTAEPGINQKPLIISAWLLEQYPDGEKKWLDRWNNSSKLLFGPPKPINIKNL